MCVRNILMKGPVKCLNDRLPYPFIYFDSWNPYPFIYLKRKKGTPFGRSLPIKFIIGSTHPTTPNHSNIIVHLRTMMAIPQGWYSVCLPCFKLDFENKNISKYSSCMFLSTTCSNVHGFFTERTRECRFSVCQRSCEVIPASEIISFILGQSYQNVCWLADYLTSVFLTVVYSPIGAYLYRLWNFVPRVSLSLSLVSLGRGKRVPGNELRLMKPPAVSATNVNTGRAWIDA